MDCVTCDKCKVWGKLQILGLGTAIRILLTPEQFLHNPENVLSRQEIIALINSLNQLAASVKFASHATDLELTDRLENVRGGALHMVILIFMVIIAIVIIRYVYLWRRKGRRGGWKGKESEESDEGETDDETSPREVNMKQRNGRSGRKGEETKEE